MSEPLDDGLADISGTAMRVLVMEGTRVIEALVARRRQLEEQARSQEETTRRAAEARIRSEAAQSRFRLSPVMTEGWWEQADRETVARRYAEAKSYEGVDASFQPYVERIEEQARSRYGMNPDQLTAAVADAQESTLGVDEARAVALSAAPQWYEVHEQLAVATDPEEARLLGDRLVKDMMLMRDEGRLDTGSARLEWARFMDSPAAVAGDDGLWDEDALDKFWDSSERARAELSVPAHEDGVIPVIPMTVAESREFAEKYAPEWVTFGQEQRLAETAKDPVARAHVESQMRYAMETYRDTGAWSHPYVQQVRAGLESNPEVDTVDNGKPVPAVARVQFGGSESARPLSRVEADEMLRHHTPAWYRDAVMAKIEPGGELSRTSRVALMASVKEDVTRLRDVGRLDTPHAQAVWASTREGTDGKDPDVVWRETAGERKDPPRLRQDDRERMGAPSAERVVKNAYEGPVTSQRRDRWGKPVEGPVWDSARRREARRKQLADKFNPDVAAAATSSSLMYSKPGGTINSKATVEKPARGARAGQRLRKGQHL